MLSLERLGSLTSELSTNLIRSIVLPGGLLHRLPKREPNRMEPTEPGTDQQRHLLPAGTVIWAGGERIPDEAIVSALHRAGGRKSRVLALAVGNDSEDLAREAARRFARYGVAEPEVVSIVSREAAERPVWGRHLEETHILLVCAQSAREAREFLLNTQCHTAAAQLLARGGVVIGVREGGAALAAQFLTISADGGPQIETGLGLMPRILLPAAAEVQQRGPGWLLGTLGTHLGVQYLGLTVEASAAVLLEQSEARVLGDATVSFLDGSEVTPTPLEAFSSQGSGVLVTADAPPVLGLKVHVLLAGYGLNLRTRRPLGPPPAAVQAVGD